MTPTEIESRLWRRRYRVDRAGITESRFDGSPLRFIPWDRLAHVDRDLLRSSWGERIRPWLELDKKNELWRTIDFEWNARFPDAWQENRARLFLRAKRLIFTYIPLFSGFVWMLGILAGLLGLTDPDPVLWARLMRSGILLLVSVGALWIFFFWANRHRARS